LQHFPIIVQGLWGHGFQVTKILGAVLSPGDHLQGYPTPQIPGQGLGVILQGNCLVAVAMGEEKGDALQPLDEFRGIFPGDLLQERR
jgi:hypothetical protein